MAIKQDPTEATREMKDALKEHRLEQYRAQIFSLEMDLAAYTALGEEAKAEKTREAIDSGKKAYAAVEVM